MTRRQRQASFRLGSMVWLAAALGACAAGGATQVQLANGRRLAPAGERVYLTKCSDCHGKRGQGPGRSPALMGPGTLPFHGHNGQTGPFGTAQDLFRYVKHEMPLPKSKRGTLSSEQYWAVVNYIVATRTGKLPPGGINADNAASVVINRH